MSETYASYANHCAIQKKVPMTWRSWLRENPEGVAEKAPTPRLNEDDGLALAIRIVERHDAGNKHVHESTQHEITRHPIPETDCIADILKELRAASYTGTLAAEKAAPAAPTRDALEAAKEFIESVRLIPGVKFDAHGHEWPESQLVQDYGKRHAAIEKINAALAGVAQEPRIGGTVGLDGDTRRCCNHSDCGNDWPCKVHPEQRK